MSAPTTMVDLVEHYLEMRRGLGYSLITQGKMLRGFARYADASGHSGPLTMSLALGWAECSKAGPVEVARRLATVRQFARHRAVFDKDTEVPPADFLPWPRHRCPPHIYSDKSIADLLLACSRLRPRGGLRPITYFAYFSLIASTGLRPSEARHLTLWDVDLNEGIVTIREGKARKSRLVPLHPTTTAELSRYKSLRDSYTHVPQSEYFFRTDHAPSLKKRAVESTFARIRSRLGWNSEARARRPRVHDLRHTFVVRRLLRWYEEGADVDHKILALSTYLGHINVTDTYWYISAVPELLSISSQRFSDFVDGPMGGSQHEAD